MSNAKIEFQELLKEVGAEVLCAELEDVYYASDTKGKTWRLPVNHTKKTAHRNELRQEQRARLYE